MATIRGSHKILQVYAQEPCSCNALVRNFIPDSPSPRKIRRYLARPPANGVMSPTVRGHSDDDYCSVHRKARARN